MVVALLFLLVCTGCDLNLGLELPDASAPKEEPETLSTVSIGLTSATVAAGAQLRFADGDEDTLYTSLDESVAIVSQDGIVTALREGETVVAATDGSSMQTCTVTVTSVSLGLRSMQDDALLAVGDTLTLTAGIPDGYTAEWSSSDEEVAAISEGILTAKKAGSARLTAVCGELSDEYTLTVLSGVEGEGDRQLLWHDEFDGDTLDESKWEYQLGVRDVYVNDGQTAYGPIFWGNNELQYYTRDAVSLVEGVTAITAARQEGLPEGRQFTSARITTRDRGYWTYGYFEARMRLPLGTGMWPAFWLLPQPEKGMGTDNRYGGWAANGEIDIMEARGRIPNEVGTTVHFGGNPSIWRSGTTRLAEPISEWHTYALEWRSDHLAWFVDGTEIFRVTSDRWYTSSPLGVNNSSAPFDVPFYLVFNLAVGGGYDGGRTPDASFISAQMQIDYVRVYA